MVVVHIAPLLLLQTALVHGVQQDPVESVQQLGLRRAKVVDGFFSGIIIDNNIAFLSLN